MSKDNIKVEIEGLKEFDELLGRLPEKLEKKYLKKLVREAIKEALPAIKAATPKDDSATRSKWSKHYGHLRDNTKVRQIRAKKGNAGAAITSGDSFWGYFLEHGARFLKAVPWFVKTFEGEAPKVIRHIEKEAATALENEWKLK